VNEKKPPARPALNLRPFDLDLKRELKAWAVLQDTDMANLAERYIREGLARDKKKAKNRRRKEGRVPPSTPQL